MVSVNKVIDIFDTASKVEEKINDGYPLSLPLSLPLILSLLLFFSFLMYSARGEYDSYFACVDMMSEAVIFLTNNKNFKSAETTLAQLVRDRSYTSSLLIGTPYTKFC